MHIHILTQAGTHTHAYTRMHIQRHTHKLMQTYTYKNTYMHAYTYTQVHTYTHANIHTNINTHINICTHRLSPSLWSVLSCLINWYKNVNLERVSTSIGIVRFFINFFSPQLAQSSCVVLDYFVDIHAHTSAMNGFVYCNQMEGNKQKVREAGALKHAVGT